MAAKAILYPMLAMVALTAIVAVTMYRRRIAEMRTRRVHPQKLALSAQMASALADTRAKPQTGMQPKPSSTGKNCQYFSASPKAA